MFKVDRIYVINLKNRPSKKERILNSILEEGLGTPVEFTEAFNLKSVDPNLLEYWLNDQGFYPYKKWKSTSDSYFEGFNFSSWDERDINIGEIGCFLSHYYIWKRAAESGESCLILEDDATWNKGSLRSFINESLPKAPRFDLLYLGRNKLSKSEESPASADGFFVNPAFSYNAHAYILTSSACEKIIAAKPESNLIPVDEFLPACWTKHRRKDIANIFKPIINAIAINKDEDFEVWQSGNQSGYKSDISHKDEELNILGHTCSCFTVSDNSNNEGLEKNICSASNFNIKVNVLGLKNKWEGGEMVNDPGGGQKINLLIPEVKKLKDNPRSLVLFVDGFDIIFLSGLETIIEKFLASGKRIIFGAEKSCWPDRSLEKEYPDSPNSYKFLNSGNFIGYASDIYKILFRAEEENLPNIYDDQLYFTHEFLRGKHKDLISLDYNCQLFQCLAYAYEDVVIHNKILYNKITQTKPSLAHGNSGKEKFWSLSNYIGSQWNKNFPYSAVGLNKDKPKIYLSIFCVNGVDMNRWPIFFKGIDLLNYPKEKIILDIQGDPQYLSLIKSNFADITVAGLNSYADVLFTDKTKQDGSSARDEACERFRKSSFDYFFYVENLCLIENSETINELIKLNKNVAAPIMVETSKGKVTSRSNFWGATSSSGYYRQSEDYFNIIQRKVLGCFVAPFVGACYLVKRRVLIDNPTPYTREKSGNEGKADPDMAFVQNLGYKRILFHADNRHKYGLINWGY